MWRLPAASLGCDEGFPAPVTRLRDCRRAALTLGLRSRCRSAEALWRHFCVLLPSVSECPPAPLPFHTAFLRVGGGNELASLLADLANDACSALHRVTAIRRLDDACVNRCVTAATLSPCVIGCMRRLLWSLNAPLAACRREDVKRLMRWRGLSSWGVTKLEVGVEENACFLCVVALCALNHSRASLSFHLTSFQPSLRSKVFLSYAPMACVERYFWRPTRGVSTTDASSALPGFTLFKLIVLDSSPH